MPQSVQFLKTQLSLPQRLLLSLGFNNVVTIDMLRESFPLLDMVDHNRRPKLPVSHLRKPLTSTKEMLNSVCLWKTSCQHLIFFSSPILLASFQRLKVRRIDFRCLFLVVGSAKIGFYVCYFCINYSCDFVRGACSMGNQPATDHRCFADQGQPQQCLQLSKHASPPPAGLQHGPNVDG